MLKHVPNILSIIRISLIPFIVATIYSNNYLLTIVLYTISGITDVLDGFFARKFNLITNIGKLIDPLADKLTQIFTIGSLVYINILPLWILIILLLKEFTMIIGASFLYGKNIVVYSKWYGKLSTVLFFIAVLLSLVINELNISNFLIHLDLTFYSLAIIFTLISLIAYIHTLRKNGFIDKNDLSKNVTIKK